MTVREYNACVERYANPVYRFILKNIRDEDRAQDVVQESFAKMWERVNDISEEKARSYLFTTAYHTMIDTIRREQRSTSLEEGHLNLNSVEQGSPDLKEVLDEAVARLPEIQRSVLMLRDYEGYSYQEIGEITGLNESQVKVYIFRARNALKKYIVSLDRVI
ncbi:MAG TPA: RNA polymerase sigma factor [Bacteroidales bacterium]|nr:RNA polymerase sigma factor [Bacteroidales bacterium]HRZ76822.1 RNA polymerase sigma factor [Bacteroidales bacterium]